MDDGVLVSTDPEALRLAFDAMCTIGPQLGLHANPSKCKLWTSKVGHKWEGFPQDVEIMEGDGLKVLGSAVGGQESATLIVGNRVKRVEELVALLPCLENSVMQYHLLRDCLGYPKVNFAFRTTDPATIPLCVASFDAVIRSACKGLFGNHVLTNTDISRLGLPIKFGGFGIIFARDEAPSAYLGSLCSSAGLQSEILSHLCSGSGFKRLSKVKSAKLLRSFCESHSVKDPPELEEILKASKPQNMLSSLAAKARARDLLAACNPLEKRQLEACALPSSGAWLDHHSYNPRDYMSSLEWLVAAKFRLGVPIFTSQVQCPECAAGVLDVFGRHATFCQGSNDCVGRHDAVKEELLSLMAGAQFSVDKETQHLLLDGNEQRPADVYVSAYTDGYPLAVDVTGVDVLCPSLSVDLGVLEILERKGDEKHHKYEAQCAAVGIGFKAFVFGSLGGFGTEASTMIKTLGKRIARVKMCLGSKEIAFIRRRLASIVQRRQASACIRRGEGAGVLIF